MRNPKRVCLGGGKVEIGKKSVGKRKRTAKENQDCGFEWNLFNFSLILVCWKKADDVVWMWTQWMFLSFYVVGPSLP